MTDFGARRREQSLVDLAFEFAIMAADRMHGKPSQEIADWVAKTLASCGFETRPRGSSHGVLVDEKAKSLILRDGGMKVTIEYL